MRRDRVIRDNLRNGSIGWRIERLRHPDLAKCAHLIKRLKGLVRQVCRPSLLQHRTRKATDPGGFIDHICA